METNYDRLAGRGPLRGPIQTRWLASSPGSLLIPTRKQGKIERPRPEGFPCENSRANPAHHKGGPQINGILSFCFGKFPCSNLEEEGGGPHVLACWSPPLNLAERFFGKKGEPCPSLRPPIKRGGRLCFA